EKRPRLETRPFFRSASSPTKHWPTILRRSPLATSRHRARDLTPDAADQYTPQKRSPGIRDASSSPRRQLVPHHRDSISNERAENILFSFIASVQRLNRGTCGLL